MKKVISFTLDEKTIKELKKKAEELRISTSALLELIIKGVIKL